jgi:dienelactone hydrolase
VFVAIAALVIGAGALTFHPSRPLYMRNRHVEIAATDGVVLRGTVSVPRWSRGPLPGIVMVHGSGPLTRRHLLGDVRGLVRRGFAVLAFDKRGAGESSGTFPRQWGDSAAAVLGCLAADAAAAFEVLAADPDVDSSRVGFFGASQAGWIIPLAAELTHRPPRFHVILSGAAVSTGLEQHYSELTGDGMRAPQVADREELERRLLGFDGRPGFDPAPLLLKSRVPTLWLLGERDESVPSLASMQVLDSIRSQGNTSYTVICYPNAGHSLRDVATGESMPVWDQMMSWLRELGVLAPEP